MNEYQDINYRVMKDTVERCGSNPVLQKAVREAIQNEKVVLEDNPLWVEEGSGVGRILLSPEYTLEAAKKYAGRKIGVLNFANNHSIGGSPFTACAQEEALCHSTTLFPCLEAKDADFYKPHRDSFDRGELTDLGNDDLIFTPGVIVFKDWGSQPKLLPEEKWFSIDVITSAAPEISRANSVSESELRKILTQRIKRILDLASSEGDEVLILGAYGCGAFGNPPEVVASVTKDLLSHYSFDIVDFAIRGHGSGLDQNFLAFQKAFENQ